MAFSLDRAVASGKALPAHPALQDFDTPISVYAPGANRAEAQISQRNAGRHGQAYGGNQAIDHVYDCIGLFADPVGSAPWHLEKPDGTKLVRERNKLTPADYEKGPEDLYRLLDNPNPHMLYDELMELLVIDLLLVGNAYWMKWRSTDDGRPLALYRLSPAYVKIIPGTWGPKRYEYQPPGARTPLKLSPDEIIHFRRPNPHDAYYGMGVIQGAGRSMDMEIAITDTVASYYENKADPSLIVESERRVPRDVFNKLRMQLRARAAGSRNAGELLLLESGLKASPLGASARDALFAELSAMSRDRIYSKFRVSPMLFGHLDESSGSNKVSDARREFNNETLRPFMGKLTRTLSHYLLAAWDVKLVIDHRQILPAEEAVKVGESVAKIPGVKVREVRRMYAQFDIPESTGDPELDEKVLNEPLGELDENGQPVDPRVPSGPDKPLSSEPGRPPKTGNTTVIGTAKTSGTKSLDEVKAELAAMQYGTKAVEFQEPDRATVGTHLPDEQAPPDTFAAARTVDINATTVSIAAELRDASRTLERALLDNVEGKALKTSDLVQRVKNNPAWKTFTERVTEILREHGRAAASSGAMHAGVTPDEELDYAAIVESVIQRPQGIRSIVRTLKDRAARRVSEVREANGERSDYESAVRAVIAEWNDGHVTTIAETESVEIYNEATLTAAESAGVNALYVTDGEDHDDACKDAHGSVWDVATARERRTEHPRCRRAFLALPAVAS